MVSSVYSHRNKTRRHQLGVKNLQQALDSRWEWCLSLESNERDDLAAVLEKKKKKKRHKRECLQHMRCCLSDLHQVIVSLLKWKMSPLAGRPTGGWLIRNCEEKSQADITPVLLIWAGPLRTLQRICADSTLWRAESAFFTSGEWKRRADYKIWAAPPTEATLKLSAGIYK